MLFLTAIFYSTITNPNLPDNPIIYASTGFYEMCGYSRAEVLGRNCRFLQVGIENSSKVCVCVRVYTYNLS